MTDWKSKYQELNEKYRTLLNHIADSYSEIDLSGTTTFINDNASNFLGYTQEEFIGKNYKEYMTPETAQKVFDIYHAVYQTGRPAKAVEYDLIAKDGSTTFIQETIILRKDASGKPIGFASFSRDITQKKQSEISLRKNEEKYRTALENLHEGYVEISFSEKIIFRNRASYTFLGYTEDELSKTHYSEYTTPETQKKIQQIYKTVYETGRPARNVEYEVIVKGGEKKFVEATVDLLRDENGNAIGFSSLMRDITEKKEIEIALKKGEEKYKKMLDYMLEAYTETDLNGKVTFANKSAAEGLGYTKEEYLQIPYKKFYRSMEEAQETFNIYNSVYKSGKPATHVEQHRVAKDGMIKTFEMRVDLMRNSLGEPIGFRTLRRDITQKKQAEIALQESEKRYRNILENMLDGYTENDLSGNTVFCNKIAAQELGYTKEEFLGKSYKEYTTPGNAEKLFAVYHKVYQTDTPVTLIEHELVAKDQRTIFVEANINLLRDDSGKPIGFSTLTRDITQKKQAEKERKKLEEQLQYAQKMESIGTLAGGIAHDFNNLLMGVLGLSSLMTADLEPSHPHYEYLTEIETYVKNAVDLTRQLLGFARGGKYEVKPTDINELLAAHNHMFGRTHKEIAVQLSYDKNLWPAEVDQSQIKQVLMNIYLNAWQAMPEGGVLHVKTKNVILDENGVLPFKVEQGRYIQISITDTGIGMDENTKQRAFDPFFTTKEKERGTGLGLPSAMGIIKNHGGFIDLHSKSGEGSTFEIYLPASSKKKIIKETTGSETVVKGSGTVLIIDDEEMILRVGERVLKRLGYDVMIAHEGNEGVDKYTKNKEIIDLVILDMIMPELSGSDTYEALKTIDPDIKVLLASGYSLDSKAKKILDMGCNGFIQKPFSMKELSHKIDEILATE